MAGLPDTAGEEGADMGRHWNGKPHILALCRVGDGVLRGFVSLVYITVFT